jgi:hypothetical protein
MYSNNAIPQLAAIAIRSGFVRRSRRWAYQANVMKTFEQSKRTVVLARVFIKTREVTGAGHTRDTPEI